MALSSLRQSFRCGHMAWLLALALWLPVMQWAAVAHALQHAGAAATEHRDGQSPLPQSCHTCVAAAAIDGAAPSAAVDSSPAPAAPHAQPQARGCPPAATAPLRAYRSRAPPPLHA